MRIWLRADGGGTSRVPAGYSAPCRDKVVIPPRVRGARVLGTHRRESCFVVSTSPFTTALFGDRPICTSTKHGEIVVDEKGRTSVPGIYAAGDVTTAPYKQIVIAMGEGAKVALGAFEDRMRSVSQRTPAVMASATASAA